MKILYGSKKDNIDITFLALTLFSDGLTLKIDSGDHYRANTFGDPCQGVSKSIIIKEDSNEVFFDASTDCIYNVSMYKFNKNESPIKTLIKYGLKKFSSKTEYLHYMHSIINLKHGNFHSEYPEQVMAVTYIPSTAKVLEIGSNVGINSMILASILDNDKNLVTLECEPKHIPFLEENRKCNGYTFNIEPSALSKVKLIQRGWHTFPLEGNTVPADSKIVSTISFEDLEKKYSITFDTIVADCEGAFFYIVQEEPYIMKNINLFLVENDYIHEYQKTAVEKFLMANGFSRIYSLGGGFKNSPCADSFYEAWKK
jgi:hypothetical protein